MKITKRGKIIYAEKEIRAGVKGFLASQGIYVKQVKEDTDELRNFLFWIAQSALSYHGLSDMAGLYCGHFFWIETKRTGKEPEGVQAQVVKMLRNQGQQVFVVNDVDVFMKEWSAWVKKLKTPS